MRPERHPAFGSSVVALAPLLAAVACFMPQDVSRQVEVQFTQVDAAPLVGDTVTIAAELLHGGARLPNAQLSFSFSNPSAMHVVAAAPASVVAVVLAAGPQTVTATASGYGAGPSARLVLQVHPALGIDSVRPRAARLGDTLWVYGSGLDTSSLVGIFAGARQLPVAAFLPADTSRPQRSARLGVWATAGMPDASILRAVGSAVAAAPDTVAVRQDDILEPNDTLPYVFNFVTDFYNPSLAMEGRTRSDNRPTVDWYRVATAPSQDLTAQWVLPRAKLSASYGLWVSDTATGPGGTFGWGIGVYPDYVASQCRNQYWSIPDVSDTVTMTFRQPAQRYDMVLWYVRSPAPSAYGLGLYHSMVTTIPPDAYESNDACDYATPLPLDSSTLPLSIDRPTDFDWFKFTVPAPGDSIDFRVAYPQPNDMDIAFYRSYLPDSLTYLGCLCSSDSTQEAGWALLPPGNWLVLVTSYATLAGTYTMTAKAHSQVVPAPPALGAAPATLRKAAHQALLRSRAAAAVAARAWTRAVR